MNNILLRTIKYCDEQLGTFKLSNVTTHLRDQILSIETYDTKNSDQMLDSIVNYAKSGVETYWVAIPDFTVVQGIEMSVSADCGDGVYEDGTSRCISVNPEHKIHFKIGVKLLRCLDQPIADTINVNIRQMVPITISSQCGCDCEISDATASNSVDCSNRGKLVCGECVCENGYEGDKCQCLEADEKNEEICRKNGTICNDQGHCVCEKCICDADTLYYGDFCECNDFNCPSTENGLCNGMGECKCGKCICEDKYTWPDCSEKNCDHSSVKAECLDSEGKNPTIPCNGHGECTCGTCACLVDEYHGPFCNFAWYPQLSCIDFKNCVEEDYFKKPIPSVCDQKIEHVEDLEQVDNPFQPHCTVWVDTCRISYQPFITSKNQLSKIIIKNVRKFKDCQSKGMIALIVIGTLLGVLVIGGLLIIAIYFVYYNLYEKEKYKELIKETQNVKWPDTQNPLYRPASGDVFNPLYIDESRFL